MKTNTAFASNKQQTIMLNQMLRSELLIELTDQQQDLLTGSADFQQKSDNFTQRLSVTNTTNTNGPSGNVSSTNTQISEIVSGGQSLVSMGASLNFPTLGSVNNLSPVSITPVNNSLGLI